MAEHLEKYIERVADVPAQLHRNFKLIRDLDARSAQLQAEIDEKCKQQLESLQLRGAKPGQQPSKRARLSQEDTPLSAEIAAAQAQVVSWAEEKVRQATVVHGKIIGHAQHIERSKTRCLVSIQLLGSCIQHGMGQQ